MEVDELVGALRSGHNRVMPRTDSSLPLSQWAPLAPVGLLLLSQAAGWLSVTRLLPLESMLASIPLTLVLLVARLAMIRLGDTWVDRTATKVGFVVHSLLVVALTVANPFTAIYSFVGYLDSGTWFRGRWMIGTVVVTAVLCAFGQAGGWYGLSAMPGVLVALIVVNVVIATFMTRLEQGRETAIEEREVAARKLQEAHDRNLVLQDQLIDQARERGVVQERARLSREIHDTVAQGLVGVIRQLEAIPGDRLEPQVRHRVVVAEDAARASLEEARRAVAALAPRQLQQQGLADAVRGELAVWTERTGQQAELSLDGEVDEAGDHGAVVLRVVQESLSNAARHAGPCTVTVSLSGSPEVIMVDVHDDGVGFTPGNGQPAGPVNGHGLAGMAARVTEVSGTVTVESAPGEGCTVSAVVPR